MWFQERDEGVFIQVKVIPGSSQNKIAGIQGDFLKVKIITSPEKGKANEQLIGFLAMKFKVNKNSIKIIRGNNTQFKLVFIPIDSGEILKFIK